MDYPNNTTNSSKQKHLNFEERVTIQLRLKDGHTPYRISKELGRSINTITNKITRGTVPQIIQNKKVMVYLADTGEAIYNRNRMNCGPKSKRCACSSFVTHACNEMRLNDWSVDAAVGCIIKSNKYKISETVKKYTNTKVYFAHPYSSHERSTNERHNGLIRKFIPKGVAISKFDIEDIAFIEDWCNKLPRKILGYTTPEELFEKALDIIYSC